MLLFLASAAFAAPHSEPVSWTYDGGSYAGYVVWDDASKDQRPGLLMVPNWMGATPQAVEKAQKIAGTRYVILVADMYGKDVRPKTTDEASKLAGALYADRPKMRGRAAAALGALNAQAGKAPLDPARVAAIGFCFGGSSVLELARSGAPISAVVSFHGGLATPKPAAAGAIKGPVLVLNGAADSYVPRKDVAAFEDEMTNAKADWQLVDFGGAVHCFTETDAASPPACVYDEKTAKRAYGMMNDFFDEVFAR